MPNMNFRVTIEQKQQIEDNAKRYGFDSVGAFIKFVTINAVVAVRATESETEVEIANDVPKEVNTLKSDPTDTKELGNPKEIIVQAIAKAGSVKNLAAILGYNAGTVSNWKNGNKAMSDEVVKKIYSYLVTDLLL